MKKTKFILSFLFFAVLGIVLGSTIGAPQLGMFLGFAAFIPMPALIGENLIPGFENSDEKEKQFVSKLQDLIAKTISDKNKGLITEELFNIKLEQIQKSIDEKLNVSHGLKKEDVENSINDIYKQIETLKQTKTDDYIFTSREKAIEHAVKELTESDDFKRWVDGGCKGETPRVNVKYSIASGRTGTVMITQNSGVVSDPYYMRNLYVRDLVPVLQTENYVHVFDEVTSFTRPALSVAENDDAIEVTMTTAESSVSAKRIPIFMDVSKTAMKAVKWLQGHLAKRMPEDVKEQEDFQLLFGDGAGNNIKGLFKACDEINLSGPSFLAGAVSSVATYNAGTQTIVTFAAAHALNNGMKITFANATHAGYNATFAVMVRTDKTIVIDVAYVAEADTSAWTGTSKYGNYNAIDLATHVDVLNAVKAIQKTGRYMVTGHVLNPIDASIIESLKDTTAQYITGKIERVNGILYIDGIAVIETDAMKVGWGFSADFRNIAELLEFTQLSVYFMSDATLEKANKVRVFANEEILFPIYNKFLGKKYNFATVKTALETP